MIGLQSKPNINKDYEYATSNESFIERFEAKQKAKEEKLKALRLKEANKVDEEEEAALAIRDAKSTKKENPEAIVARM